MQYKNPANRELVLEGLKMTGRMDLVGYGTKCLIRPIREGHGEHQGNDGVKKNNGRSGSRNNKGDSYGNNYSNNKNGSRDNRESTGRNTRRGLTDFRGNKRNATISAKKSTIRNTHKKSNSKGGRK